MAVEEPILRFVHLYNKNVIKAIQILILIQILKESWDCNDISCNHDISERDFPLRQTGWSQYQTDWIKAKVESWRHHTIWARQWPKNKQC